MNKIRGIRIVVFMGLYIGIYSVLSLFGRFDMVTMSPFNWASNNTKHNLNSTHSVSIDYNLWCPALIRYEIINPIAYLFSPLLILDRLYVHNAPNT